MQFWSTLSVQTFMFYQGLRSRHISVPARSIMQLCSIFNDNPSRRMQLRWTLDHHTQGCLDVHSITNTAGDNLISECVVLNFMTRRALSFMVWQFRSFFFFFLDQFSLSPQNHFFKCGFNFYFQSSLFRHGSVIAVFWFKSIVCLAPRTHNFHWPRSESLFSAVFRFGEIWLCRKFLLVFQFLMPFTDNQR